MAPRIAERILIILDERNLIMFVGSSLGAAGRSGALMPRTDGFRYFFAPFCAALSIFKKSRGVRLKGHGQRLAWPAPADHPSGTVPTQPTLHAKAMAHQNRR
jgi:hypothetical protein